MKHELIKLWGEYNRQGRAKHGSMWLTPNFPDFMDWLSKDECEVKSYQAHKDRENIINYLKNINKGNYTLITGYFNI